MIFAVHLLLYTLPCWAVNATLNIWYELKLRNKKLATLDAPLDLRRKFFDGERILGDSTTWVGLPIAIVAGTLLETFLTSPRIGMLKGLLVYVGHALGSCIKRRFHVPRGKFVPVIDHGDSIITIGIVFYSLHLESIVIVLSSIALTLIAQPLITYTAHALKWRDNPF